MMDQRHVMADYPEQVTRRAPANKSQCILLSSDHMCVSGRRRRVGAGSGLTGLRDRVAAVDGRFTLTSPPGGGTTIAVEVPCES